MFCAECDKHTGGRTWLAGYFTQGERTTILYTCQLCPFVRLSVTILFILHSALLTRDSVCAVLPPICSAHISLARIYKYKHLQLSVRIIKSDVSLGYVDNALVLPLINLHVYIQQGCCFQSESIYFCLHLGVYQLLCHAITPRRMSRSTG